MWFQRNRTSNVNPEAARAVTEAKAVLRRVQAREQEVHEVAEASRKFRRENHFADSLQDLFTPQGGA